VSKRERRWLLNLKCQRDVAQWIPVQSVTPLAGLIVPRDAMRVLVDLNKCQIYAQCCFLAPSVFRLEGDEVLTYDPGPDDELREKVRNAAAACPTQAISVEPDGLERP
jgi:ferredoxin